MKLWVRRAVVAVMRKEGFTPTWMAAYCEVSRQTIYTDLKALDQHDAPAKVIAALTSATNLPWWLDEMRRRHYSHPDCL